MSGSLTFKNVGQRKLGLFLHVTRDFELQSAIKACFEAVVKQHSRSIVIP